MGKITMRTVARINAANVAAYLVATAFFPETMQTYMGHCAGVDLDSPQAKVMSTLNLTLYLAGFALYYAVTKLSTEAAIRKALQYGIAGWLILAFAVVAQGRGYLPPLGLYVKSGWMVIGALLNAYAIYGPSGKKVASVAPYSGGDKSYTTCLRIEYGQLLIWGLAYVLCPWLGEESLKGLPEGQPGTFFVTIRGAVLLGYAILYMAISQTDAASQKVVLQFGMVRRLLLLFHVLCMNSGNVLASADGLNKLYGMIAYEVINICYNVSVLYPCGNRRWLCRAVYAVFFYVGFLNIFYPSLAATLIQEVNHAGSTSYLVGLYQIMIAIVFMAVSQTDYDTQHIFVEYSAVAHFLFICLEGFAGLKGGLMTYASFAFLVASLADIYMERFPMQKSASPSTSMMKSAASASPMKSMSSAMKKRARSKTPGRK